MPPASGVRAGRAFVELGVSDKIEAGIRRAQRRLRQFSSFVSSIGTSMLKFAAPVVAGLGLAAKSFAATGDRLEKLSRRTGIAVEELSKLDFIASQNGVSLESLEKILRRMSRTVYDAERGLSTAVDGLNDLGLSVEDLQGLSPVELFNKFGKAVSGIKDDVRRAAIEMTLFGRSGTELSQIFNDAATPIPKLIERMERLNLIMSSESAQKAAKLTDAMDELWRTVKMTVFFIGEALAGDLTTASTKFADLAAGVVKWVRDNKALIKSVAVLSVKVAAWGAALVAAGIALKGLAAALGIVAVAAKVATLAFGTLTAAVALLASPVGAVGAALVALGAVIVSQTGVAEKGFQGMAESAKTAYAAIAEAFTGGDIEGAMEILWASIKVIWAKGAASVEEIFDGMVLGIQKKILGLIDRVSGVKKEATDTFDYVAAIAGGGLTGPLAVLGLDLFKPFADVAQDPSKILRGIIPNEQLAEVRNRLRGQDEGPSLVELAEMDYERARKDREKRILDAQKRQQDAIASSEARRAKAAKEAQERALAERLEAQDEEIGKARSGIQAAGTLKDLAKGGLEPNRIAARLGEEIRASSESIGRFQVSALDRLGFGGGLDQSLLEQNQTQTRYLRDINNKIQAGKTLTFT